MISPSLSPFPLAFPVILNPWYSFFLLKLVCCLCFGKLSGLDFSLEKLVYLCVRSTFGLWIEEEDRNQKKKSEAPEEEADLDIPACALIRE